jgi:serine/threonine protein kinase
MDGSVALADFGEVERAQETLLEDDFWIQAIAYRAPEIAFRCASFSQAIDVWAFGLIVFCKLSNILSINILIS